MLKGSQTRYILLTASNHNKDSDIQTKSFLMEGQSRCFRVDFSLLVCGQSPPIPCCEFLEHGGAVSGWCPPLQVPGGGRGWRSSFCHTVRLSAGGSICGTHSCLVDGKTAIACLLYGGGGAKQQSRNSKCSAWSWGGSGGWSFPLL